MSTNGYTYLPDFTVAGDAVLGSRFGTLFVTKCDPDVILGWLEDFTESLVGGEAMERWTLDELLTYADSVNINNEEN